MPDVSGANIRIGANSDGAIAELARLRSQFALFTRQINTSVVNSYQSANREAAVFRRGLTQLGNDLTSIGGKMLLLAALPTIFAFKEAYKSFAEVQRLERGLSQYGETLEKIRRIAKEPNIGVFDGAKALIGLRAARLESQLAERAVRSFANAITLGGGNSADLEPALFNLKQFKATQNINQVDLRQLANRVPQTMEVLEKAFGTLDPGKLNQLGIDKFIEGFISGLEELPKAAGGASVSMEQLADSFTFFKAAFGEGLDRTFDVSGKISSLGSQLDNLSVNFKSLNPDAQKSIVWMTSLGVAIPVVITAVGTLIKLWPLLVTAFPIAGTVAAGIALAGVGAAIGGLIALYPVLTNKTAEYRQQQELVANIAPKMQPLIDKYDALKAIVNPTVEEQKKLRQVIAQIAELAPSAATGWDKYGKAIDINKSKVSSFIGELKKALVIMDVGRRQAIVDENKLDTYRINKLKGELTSGVRTTTVSNGLGQYQNITQKLSAQDLQKAAEELAQISARRVEKRKELAALGGAEIKKEVTELNVLIQKRKDLNKEYDQARSFGDLDANRADLDKRASVIDKQIVDKRKTLVPLIKEYNAAIAEKNQGGAAPKKGALGDPTLAEMSITQLEEKIKNLKESYENLNPTAKNFRTEQVRIAGEIKKASGYLDSQSKLLNDVTKKTKTHADTLKDLTEQGHILKGIQLASKYFEEVAAVKSATTAYKELIGVTASLSIKRLALSNSTKNPIGLYQPTRGDLAALKSDDLAQRRAAAQKAKDRLNEIADRRIPQTLNSIDNARDNDKVFQAKQNAPLELKQFFGSKTTLKEMRTFFADLKKLAGETDEEFAARVYRIVDLTTAMSQGISGALRSAAADTAEAFGELIGNLATGTGGIKEFANRLVGTLASMLKDMGKTLIAAGTAGIALKVLGKNPYLAIAAGIGLVALGTITANKIQSQASGATRKFAKGAAVYSAMPAIVGDNPNARFDPEIISPLSKVEKMIKSGMKEMDGNGQVIIPDVTVRGSDLVIVFNRANNSNQNLRGF